MNQRNFTYHKSQGSRSLVINNPFSQLESGRDDDNLFKGLAKGALNNQAMCQDEEMKERAEDIDEELILNESFQQQQVFSGNNFKDMQLSNIPQKCNVQNQQLDDFLSKRHQPMVDSSNNNQQQVSSGMQQQAKVDDFSSTRKLDQVSHYQTKAQQENEKLGFQKILNVSSFSKSHLVANGSMNESSIHIPIRTQFQRNPFIQKNDQVDCAQDSREPKLILLEVKIFFEDQYIECFESQIENIDFKVSYVIQKLRGWINQHKSQLKIQFLHPNYELDLYLPNKQQVPDHLTLSQLIPNEGFHQKLQLDCSIILDRIQQGQFYMIDKALKIVGSKPEMIGIQQSYRFLVEWQERSDGFKPANTLMSEETIMHYQPQILFDYYKSFHFTYVQESNFTYHKSQGSRSLVINNPFSQLESGRDDDNLFKGMAKDAFNNQAMCQDEEMKERAEDIDEELILNESFQQQQVFSGNNFKDMQLSNIPQKSNVQNQQLDDFLNKRHQPMVDISNNNQQQVSSGMQQQAQVDDFSSTRKLDQVSHYQTKAQQENEKLGFQKILNVSSFSKSHLVANVSMNESSIHIPIKTQFQRNPFIQKNDQVDCAQDSREPKLILLEVKIFFGDQYIECFESQIENIDFKVSYVIQKLRGWINQHKSQLKIQFLHPNYELDLYLPNKQQVPDHLTLFQLIPNEGFHQKLLLDCSIILDRIQQGQFYMIDRALKIVGSKPEMIGIQQSYRFLVEWQERPDGFKPANTLMSEETIMHYQPQILFDYYKSFHFTYVQESCSYLINYN
eukprot:403375635